MDTITAIAFILVAVLSIMLILAMRQIRDPAQTQVPAVRQEILYTEPERHWYSDLTPMQWIPRGFYDWYGYDDSVYDYSYGSGYPSYMNSYKKRERRANRQGTKQKKKGPMQQQTPPQIINIHTSTPQVPQAIPTINSPPFDNSILPRPPPPHPSSSSSPPPPSLPPPPPSPPSIGPLQKIETPEPQIKTPDVILPAQVVGDASPAATA